MGTLEAPHKTEGDPTRGALVRSLLVTLLAPQAWAAFESFHSNRDLEVGLLWDSSSRHNTLEELPHEFNPVMVRRLPFQIVA